MLTSESDIVSVDGVAQPEPSIGLRLLDSAEYVVFLVEKAEARPKRQLKLVFILQFYV